MVIISTERCIRGGVLSLRVGTTRGVAAVSPVVGAHGGMIYSRGYLLFIMTVTSDPSRRVLREVAVRSRSHGSAFQVSSPTRRVLVAAMPLSVHRAVAGEGVYPNGVSWC